MSWHKTKLALIFVLLLIDVFLAFTVYKTYKSAKIVPDELITEAKENLENRGITFDTAAIDRKYSVKSIYKYTVNTIFAEEMKQNADKTHPCLVKAISYLSSSGKLDTSLNVSYFDVPEGTSLSIFDKNDRSISSAIITGKTELEYSDNDFSSPEVVTKIRANLSDDTYTKNGEKLPKLISEFFSKTYGDEIGARCISKEDVDSGELYTCILTISDDDINGMKVCFYVRNEKILLVKGSLFFNLPTAEYQARIIDSINILYSIPQFSGDIVNVSYQDHEYNAVELENGEMYVYPVWRLECETKGEDPTSFYPVFNALTGEYIPDTK